MQTDMTTAPKDRRILILTETKGYFERGGWSTTGTQWIEAWWQEARQGRPAEFVEWCGNPRTQTTGSLFPLAWAEVPSPDCDSCGGLNVSCPDGCGRDPKTGELNGTRKET
jgi:hypothetical protein